MTIVIADGPPLCPLCVTPLNERYTVVKEGIAICNTCNGGWIERIIAARQYMTDPTYSRDMTVSHGILYWTPRSYDAVIAPGLLIV